MADASAGPGTRGAGRRSVSKYLLVTGALVLIIGFFLWGSGGAEQNLGCYQRPCTPGGQGEETFGSVLLVIGGLVTLMGLLALAVTSGNKALVESVQPRTPAPAPAAAATGRVEQLAELSRLRDSGALTDAEFQQVKAEILETPGSR